jgi:hypothetical protein
VSEARGEYVPAPCTHRPSKHPSEVRMRPPCGGRIWVSQGGLSRNKVAVGESAAGSPPTDRDWGLAPAHVLGGGGSTHSSRRPSTYELPGLTCTAEGPIAQWQSAAFARRRPWVQIPVGPSPARPKTCPLSGSLQFGRVRKTDAPPRASAGGKGRCMHPFTTGCVNETVCTCDPGVHWTRSSSPIDVVSSL